MNYRQILAVALLGITVVSSIPLEKERGNRRLIKISEKDPGKWLTRAEIFSLIQSGQHFIDITDVGVFTPQQLALAPSKTAGIPTSLRYGDVVKQAISNIDLARIEAFLKEFTDFHNRFYDDELGEESEKFLLNKVFAAVQGYPGAVSVSEFNHRGWRQNSIIARLEGANGSVASEIIILGAHQDSINSKGSHLRAPGADDNASGVITVLEALRAIVSKKIRLERTVEFHWYAGEEAGLLGSREIARKYRDDGVDVVGMMNYDVVGYHVAGNEDVAIITDYVDDDLTEFLRILVDGYLDYGRRERECGYACSDHAAWTEVGYPACRPTQAVRNGQMHTVNDTIETVNFVQVREFVKVGLGYVIELAEPANH